jgi:GSH-dependent disulfide-bond oxidoreductase
MKFHYNLSPSPLKVALLLEELEVSYEAIPVDLRGKSHEKVPTLQDGSVIVFDSGAILLYLADRDNRFLPPIHDPQLRAKALSWLHFIASDLEQACNHARHFRYIAPQFDHIHAKADASANNYALNLFDEQAHRHWTAIEDHLATHTYFLGEYYSIVDMAFWGWSRLLPNVLGQGDAIWERYPNVKRLTDLIGQRPAAKNVEKLKTKYNFKVARRYRPSVLSPMPQPGNLPPTLP